MAICALVVAPAVLSLRCTLAKLGVRVPFALESNNYIMLQRERSESLVQTKEKQKHLTFEYQG